MLDLIAIAKTTRSLYSFAQGDDLSDVLGAIGGVHFEAAKNALSHVHKASQPREAINRVITHLEVAHIVYEKAWLEAPRTKAYRADKDSMKDIYACCLLAACHKALGDAKELIEKYLEAAYVAVCFHYGRFGEYSMNDFAFDMLNPRNWVDLFRDKEDSNAITPEQFGKFCKMLLEK